MFFDRGRLILFYINKNDRKNRNIESELISCIVIIIKNLKDKERIDDKNTGLFYAIFCEIWICR